LFKNRGVITQKNPNLISSLKKKNITSSLLPKTLATKRKIDIKERKQRERERRENLVTY
jgi:hypothetical protein